MKVLRWRRIRLNVWWNDSEGLAELLPCLLLTATWPTAWLRCRPSGLAVVVGWLRWSGGVTLEVRHG